jgi:endonuclease-3
MAPRSNKQIKKAVKKDEGKEAAMIPGALPPKKALSKQPKLKKQKVNTNSKKSISVRPSMNESRFATLSLAKVHPYVVNTNDTRRQTMLEACGMRNSVTDSIISTMLSQNTTDKNSKAAWASLKENFPSWDLVVECDDISKIEDSIRVAGLAKTRAERIQAMLRTVKKERGEASLDYIREFNDEQVKAELKRFKGLGPKTISCVLLFALGRDEFPVDTHVLRITQKMGWIPPSASREKAYEYLNEMIPNDVKMDLHCLLVRHGKVCHRCAANGRPQFPPDDGSKLECPLVNVSSWNGAVPVQLLDKFGLGEKNSKIKTEGKQGIVKNECIPDKVKSE